jgi:NADH-quinone oxidoreductase subunit M
MLPKLSDLNVREFGMLVPLVVLVFWIGLYPRPLLDVMHASVARVIATQSTSFAVRQGEPVRVKSLVMTLDPPATASAMIGEATP